MKQAKIFQVGQTNHDKIELDQQNPVGFTPEEALFFFLTGVKVECIYTLCVGLAKDNTIPLSPKYPNIKVPQKKSKKL